jgi:hypothetical protein
MLEILESDISRLQKWKGRILETIFHKPDAFSSPRRFPKRSKWIGNQASEMGEKNC